MSGETVYVPEPPEEHFEPEPLDEWKRAHSIVSSVSVLAVSPTAVAILAAATMMTRAIYALEFTLRRSR